jgi:hypothetical protein
MAGSKSCANCAAHSIDAWVGESSSMRVAQIGAHGVTRAAQRKMLRECQRDWRDVHQQRLYRGSEMTTQTSTFERELSSLTDVLSRPPGLSLRQPEAIIVTKTSDRITITYTRVLPDWPMTAVMVAVLLGVILYAAREVATSLGFGWPAAIGMMVAALAPLGLLARSGNTKLVIDGDQLRVYGPAGDIALPKRRVAAIVTHQDTSLAFRAKSFHVRAVTADDSLFELGMLASKEECWWLQEQLECALELRSSG